MGFRLSIRELKQTTAMTATETSLIRTVAVHVHYKSLYIS